MNILTRTRLGCRPVCRGRATVDGTDAVVADPVLGLARSLAMVTVRTSQNVGYKISSTFSALRKGSRRTFTRVALRRTCVDRSDGRPF